MGLNPSQRKIALKIIRTGKRRGATKKELISALETGLVEANLSNPASGDSSSVGWRQELDTYGSVAKRRNVVGAANRYFDETKAAGRGRGMSAGQLAQAVQRSAFPSRYQERSAEAKAILRRLGRLTEGQGATQGGKGSKVDKSSQALLTPTGLDPSTVLSFINTKNKTASDFAGIAAARAQAAQAAQQSSQSTIDKKAKKNGTKQSQTEKVDTSQAGLANFEGTQVAAWIAPALKYARSQGWKGQINSGYRSDAEQTRIYKSGVRPAAVPKSMGGGGSNHSGKKFPEGAIDVSDAAQLSAILKKSKYRKKLVYAGSKDPVHFSHPHNGSY